MHSFFALAGDIEKYALSCYLNELTTALTVPDFDNPALCRLLLYALYALEGGKRDPELVKAAFEWRIMAESGYAPDLTSCGVCGEEHLAECSADKLLHGRGIGLACPDTKMLCCFIGEDYAVEHEMEQLSLAAAKEREQGDDPAAFADSVIMYEILSELKEIAARKDGITCSCGSKSYGMEIHSTYVDLVCKSCGAKLRIGAATDEDLDRLCCRMKLQIKSE